MLDNDSALSFMKKLENIMGMSIIGSRDILIACLLGTLSCSAMGDSPKRAMPFLCKNSVVTESPEKVPLIGNEVPVIVLGNDIPRGSDEKNKYYNNQIAKAGDVLAKYIGKISGKKCRIISHDESKNISSPKIYVGVNGDTAKEFPEMSKADLQGFLITRKGDDLYIAGASGIGTLYGTWFFLYNYAGLRIVMPGDIGEVYEKNDRMEIPSKLYVFNPGPDFLMRVWSQNGFDLTTWLQDDSKSSRFLYHHAWGQVAPPSKYGKTNPEFYPVIGGKRYIPNTDKAGSWQPTFTEPSLLQHVVKYADEKFTANPDLKSISLTLNDGGGYSELDMKDGIKDWRKNYFTFINSAAREIAKKWPDKYVAILSYGEAKEAPDFKLEDNVILFIFSYQGNPDEVVQAWKGKVRHFGVYQWLYGAGWVIPNHWPHAIRDYLKYIQSLGGLAFKGEANVAWAQEGAKMWVLSNLLWNTDADVDALLNDYFEHCYGKEAAPAMAEYFARAEKMYERRRDGNNFNITRYRCGTYQFEQAADEDFELMGKALAKAKALVKGDANITRLDWTSRCFTHGLSYWKTYKACKSFTKLANKKDKTESELKAMFGFANEFIKLARDAEEYQQKHIAPVPNYCHQDPSHRYWLGAGFHWTENQEAVAQEFSSLTAEMLKKQSPGEVAEYWGKIAGQYPELKIFTDAQILNVLHKDEALKNLLSNGSFEEAANPESPDQKQLLQDVGNPKVNERKILFGDWNDYAVSGMPARDWVAFDRINSTLKTSLDNKVVKDEKYSLCIAGTAFYGGAMCNFIPPVNPGRYRLSFWYRTECGEKSSATYGISYYKSWGFEMMIKPLQPSPEWQKVTRDFTVNSSNQDEAVTIALRSHYHKTDEKIWFDDVRVELLSTIGMAGK